MSLYILKYRYYVSYNICYINVCVCVCVCVCVSCYINISIFFRSSVLRWFFWFRSGSDLCRAVKLKGPLISYGI